MNSLVDNDDSHPVLECAICLQQCIHPVRLPCSHMFCYLCMKGVAVRNRRCALCRAEIPEDFVRRPTLVTAQGAVQSKNQEPSSDDGMLLKLLYLQFLHFLSFSKVHSHLSLSGLLILNFKTSNQDVCRFVISTRRWNAIGQHVNLWPYWLCFVLSLTEM